MFDDIVIYKNEIKCLFLILVDCFKWIVNELNVCKFFVFYNEDVKKLFLIVVILVNMN